MKGPKKTPPGPLTGPTRRGTLNRRKKMMKHTPLPWSPSNGGLITANTPDKGHITVIADVFTASTTEEEQRNNEVFIYKACNSYYDLVEVAKKAIESLEARRGRALADGNKALVDIISEDLDFARKVLVEAL